MTPESSATEGQLLAFARDIRELYRLERERARELEQALSELRRSYLATMETLATLVEAKDEGTRHHLDRSRDLALALTRAVDPGLADRPEIEYGFRLHDIGKVGIPEHILGKRSALTPAEWAVMRTHPTIGAEVVAPLEFLGEAVDVIRFHHEKYNGSGYPFGLERSQIPLAARIFSVVDAYDAMTNDRPYRHAMPAEAAVERIRQGAGTQFDPEIVAAFIDLLSAADGGPFGPETKTHPATVTG
jgi:HD-GYP domain-containing protein (c-di-GMP phosphodiesterase class II)